MKFLVFSTDLLPITGLPTSGTALRTNGLVSGLRELGHEVEVSVPKNAIEGASSKAKKSEDPSKRELLEKELSKLSEKAFDSRNQEDLIRNTDPDAVICGHWPAHTIGGRISCPLVIDLAGPHLLERHYQKSPNQRAAILGKTTAMRSADLLIASGASQRLYFLSFLQRAAVKNAQDKFIEVPMPLPPETPQRLSTGPSNSIDPQFVFGGVFLPWQNPAKGLRGLNSLIEKEQYGKLKLIGGEHPNYPVNEGIYAKLFAELERSSRVERLPMLPYEKFIETLLSCDVALDLMKWNLERELAVTIRTTTYLWAGVPIIYNDYADLKDVIKQYDAGWCINPEDSNALQEVYKEIRSNPEIVAQKSANAQRLAREVFSWKIAAERIVEGLSRDSGMTGELVANETDIELDFPHSAETHLNSSNTLTQKFECRVDGMHRIEFRIATHGEEVKSGIKLSLEDSNGSSVAESVLAAKDIKNNQWHSFDFEPLSGSAGQSYRLHMQATEASTNRLSPWLCHGKPYPLEGLYQEGKRIGKSSLCIKTTCRRN